MCTRNIKEMAVAARPLLLMKMAGDSKIAADCDSARRSCDWDAHHIILCCFSVVFLLLWPLCRLLSFCSSSEASQTKEEQQQQAQVVNCRLKETTLQQRIYLRSVARLHRVQLQSNMYPQILFLLLILNRIQISTKSSRDTRLRLLLSLDISLFPCLSLFPFRSLTLSGESDLLTRFILFARSLALSLFICQCFSNVQEHPPIPLIIIKLLIYYRNQTNIQRESSSRPHTTSLAHSIVPTTELSIGVNPSAPRNKRSAIAVLLLLFSLALRRFALLLTQWISRRTEFHISDYYDDYDDDGDDDDIANAMTS